MKLTNEQRLLVYEKLFKVVCEDPSVKYGMCRYLNGLLDGSEELPYSWCFHGGVGKMEYLPELNKYNNHVAAYWAPLTKSGWETRIGWIEQAIIDVKNKIKNHEN